MNSHWQLLPELSEGRDVYPIDVKPQQHFTQPPPRYTEASLVKKLEEQGIGRPSTYASIIQTIQDREYVSQRDRRFYATMLGSVVTQKLIQAFPEIMNVQFTTGMETELDKIEEADLDWIKLLRDFYGPFHEDVESALEKLEHAGGADSPYTCEKCGGLGVMRTRRTLEVSIPPGMSDGSRMRLAQRPSGANGGCSRASTGLHSESSENRSNP